MAPGGLKTFHLPGASFSAENHPAKNTISLYSPADVNASNVRQLMEKQHESAHLNCHRNRR